ncbi:MAG: hypothetical protein ACRBBP_04205 [Bdellovibrionales bacterium]
MKNSKTWWAPITSHFLTLLALLIITLFSFQILNSRALIIGGLGVVGMLGPLVLVWVHRGSLKISLIIQTLCFLMGYILRPTNLSGNWKMGVAEHMFMVTVVCFLFCAIAQSLYLKKEKWWGEQNFARYD